MMKSNNCAICELTEQNICAIMVLPNIGKENIMKHESREEVLERVLMKLAKLTDKQVEEIVRVAAEQGINLADQNEPRE